MLFKGISTLDWQVSGESFTRVFSVESVVLSTWKKIEWKGSITHVENKFSAQGLTSARALVLNLNYRCNTFARDTGINFVQAVQEGEDRRGGSREQIR